MCSYGSLFLEWLVGLMDSIASDFCSCWPSIRREKGSGWAYSYFVCCVVWMVATPAVGVPMQLLSRSWAVDSVQRFHIFAKNYHILLLYYTVVLSPVRQNPGPRPGKSLKQYSTTLQCFCGDGLRCASSVWVHYVCNTSTTTVLFVAIIELYYCCCSRTFIFVEVVVWHES